MFAIFDRHGSTVAWAKSPIAVNQASNGVITIYSLDGEYLAFIKRSIVFSPDGNLFGYYNNGFFRDSKGGAVAFVESCMAGGLTPVLSVTPIETIGSVTPVTPVENNVRVMPMALLTWSKEMTWSQFITKQRDKSSQQAKSTV